MSMIGTRLLKDNTDGYIEVALWCNRNGAIIIEHGEYYEVVEPTEETVTKEDKLEAIRSEYLPKFEAIKKGILATLATGGDISPLQHRYKQYVKEMKEKTDKVRLEG